MLAFDATLHLPEAGKLSLVAGQERGSPGCGISW